MKTVAVTRIGVCCPLGDTPEAVWQAVQAGTSALKPHPPLQALPDARAGVVERIDFRRWLRRRKDAKLMTRAARLALTAAGRALTDWSGDRAELGLFFGVGREPPDEGEAEAALVAAAAGGRFDPTLLAGRGRDLYPPLLPLKTLPNMALAHVSIHLGLQGENGAWAGGAEAASRALIEGVYAVAEERSPAALVGAADSLIDLGSARDRLRMGASGPPGEAAAALLLAPAREDLPALAWLRPRPQHVSEIAAPEGMGDCGAGGGGVALALAVWHVYRDERSVIGPGVEVAPPGAWSPL